MMKEEYTFNVLVFKAQAGKKVEAKAEAEEEEKSLLLCGPYGRGRPGMENDSAGYLYLPLLLPDEAGRGQPPPGGRIVIRGREPCGDALNALNPNALNPNAVRQALTGFATVHTLEVRRRNGGLAGFRFVHDSCVRRRFKDLSACAAPDNVWVRDGNLSACAASRWIGTSSHNGWVRASNPNFDRQALSSFRTVQPGKVCKRKEGPVEIKYVDDSGVRRRFKDLSACAAPDNVWVRDGNLSACAASRWIGTSSDNVWVHANVRVSSI